MNSDSMDFVNASALAILVDELPDPHVLLHIQALPEFATFALFPQLPSELRIMIYKLTSVPPEVNIIARYTRDRRQVLNFYSPYHPTPPACLRINREARNFALGHYHGIQGTAGNFDCLTYFNPDVDVFHFSQISFKWLYYVKEIGPFLDKARVVILEDCKLVVFFSDYFGSFAIVDYFERLKANIERAIRAGRFRKSCSLHIQGPSKRDILFLEEDELKIGAANFKGSLKAFVPGFPDLKVPEIFFF